MECWSVGVLEWGFNNEYAYAFSSAILVSDYENMPPASWRVEA